MITVSNSINRKRRLWKQEFTCQKFLIHEGNHHRKQTLLLIMWSKLDQATAKDRRGKISTPWRGGGSPRTIRAFSSSLRILLAQSIAISKTRWMVGRLAKHVQKTYTSKPNPTLPNTLSKKFSLGLLVTIKKSPSS